MRGWNLPDGCTPEDIDARLEPCRCCGTCASGICDGGARSGERYCLLIDDYVPEGHSCGHWKEG